MNRLYSLSELGPRGPEVLQQIQEGLAQAVSDSMIAGKADQLKTDFGLSFNLKRRDTGIVELSRAGRRNLVRRLDNDSRTDQVQQFLFGNEKAADPNERAGLMDRLQSLLDSAEQRLLADLGPTGTVVDIYV